MARIVRGLKIVSRDLIRKYWYRGQDPFSRWFAAKGDDTLRLNLPLSRNSVVFDLGGYRGQWASDVFAKYQCMIHVFEPVPEFAEFIRKRFEFNDQIKTHVFGLGATDSQMEIHLNENSSSLVATQGGHSTTVQVRDVVKALEELVNSDVDTMKINIEGGEFDLLDRILDAGVINRFRHLQIQFHNFFPTAPARRHAIRERLAKTHKCDYCFEFVWEGWTRR